MRRTLATAVLVLAGLVPAGPGRAWSGPAPVRVVLPAAGEELVAGSLATLAWEREDVDGPSRIAEWEAFLSLDGGRSWPLRLTPHLDLGIRRFTFRVPAFPSREVRLLLRFGDERGESEVEVPGSFTISVAQDWAVLEPVPPSLRLSRGEAARPGEHGVVLWMEGTRDGAGLREVASEETSPEWQGVHVGRGLLLPLLWPAAGREALPPPESAELAPPAAFCERVPATAAVPRPAAETRLLIHRYNE